MIENKFSWKRWYKKHNLDPREYQFDALDDLWKNLTSGHDRLVLACSPASGKTNMSIAFCEAYVNKYPKRRILVLTHGITILRSQYVEVLKKVNPDFTWTTDLATSNKAKVTVAIPQSFRDRIIGTYDLVIIDEAHHYYMKPMVTNILDSSGWSHLLLLSATPYNMVKDDIHVITCVDMCTLYKLGYIHDAHVKVLVSDYKYNSRDYNRDHDLKISTKLNKKQTNTSLLKMCKVIFEKSIDKTMFVCRNIKQAMDTHRFLSHKYSTQGIGVVISTSGHTSSGDVAVFKEFVNNDSCKILIVVNRGILGFDFPGMVNLVDMSGTSNISKLYQMYARLVRPLKGKIKTFYKITTDDMQFKHTNVMSAALHLCDEEYLLMYNGDDFSDTKFIAYNFSASGVTNRVPDGNTKSKYQMDIPDLGIDLLIQLKEYRRLGKLPIKFMYTTMDEVNYQLSDKIDWLGHPDSIEADAKKYTVKTHWQENNRSAFNAAIKLGIVDKCCEHMIQHNKGSWSDEEIWSEAGKYTYVTDWYKNSPGSYAAARRRGLINEIVANMEYKNTRYDNKTILDCARKFETFREWRANHKSMVHIARLRGIMHLCRAHMKKSIKAHSNKELIAIAKQEKVKVQFVKKFPGIRDEIRKRGLEDKCYAHMEVTKRNYTDKDLIKIGKKYETTAQFRIGSESVYKMAYKRGILDKCCAHMAIKYKYK